MTLFETIQLVYNTLRKLETEGKFCIYSLVLATIYRFPKSHAHECIRFPFAGLVGVLAGGGTYIMKLVGRETNNGVSLWFQGQTREASGWKEPPPPPSKITRWTRVNSVAQRTRGRHCPRPMVKKENGGEDFSVELFTRNSTRAHLR